MRNIVDILESRSINAGPDMSGKPRTVVTNQHEVGQLVELFRGMQKEMSAYRKSFGCLSCGENHPVGTDCPPVEVRTGGTDSCNETSKRVVEQLRKLLAERDEQLREVKEYNELLRKEIMRDRGPVF